jgi:5-formyltetrahydrofolate cyclo-ligase
MLSKDITRSIIIAKCVDLSKQEQQSAAEKLLNNLYTLLSGVNSVAIYNSYGFELDLSNIIKECIKLDKKTYQPIAYRDTRIMKFALVDDPRQKTKIFYNKDDEISVEIEWYNIDLVLMPIVAVSKSGYRLGKGGGYYDATFAKINELEKKPVLCGVGFDLQLIDKLVVDEWDIKLDYFVSDKRVMGFK